MQLELESGAVIENVTESDLARIEGEEFAILSWEGGDTYIQCAEGDDTPGEYVLEYQDGNLDRHYEAVNDPITFPQILSAFTKYLRHDPSWLDDFEWKKMDLGYLNGEPE